MRLETEFVQISYHLFAITCLQCMFPNFNIPRGPVRFVRDSLIGIENPFERHHHLLDGIDSLEDIGCFGLTELGFGNNAVEMQTTAVYNKDDDTITINTPTELAHKYWITNGALHAQHCVVFAQLQVDGEWHGVHAILCQIRDGVAGQTMPGVTINDMGHRMGLNGVDNALLSFDNVKVPRTNLLNKYSDISEDGKFRKLLQMTFFIRIMGHIGKFLKDSPTTIFVTYQGSAQMKVIAGNRFEGVF